MELSAEVSAGLKALADVKTFNAAQFSAVAEATTVSLLRETSVEQLLDSHQGLAGVDRRTLKLVHGALATLLLEAARQGFDDELFGSVLSEQGFGPKQAELLGGAYAKHRDALRVLLGRSTFHFPHIVDLEWRMDYHIKSANVERVDEFEWLVTLKTIDKGAMRDVTFSANREEMQELLSKMKDALSAAERLVAM